MESNEIEINGKIIKLDDLSDEELDKLEEYLLEERKRLRQKIDEHIEMNQINNNN